MTTENQAFIERVKAYLTQELEHTAPELFVFAKHLLGAEGKFLRAAFLERAAYLTGGVTDEHVLAGTIIELIHLATLVHDDVLDNAATRRGRPTLGAVFGVKNAVLFGDYLFARASGMAGRFVDIEVPRLISEATERVCLGEILQNQNVGNYELPLCEYERIVALKTGELFGVACELAGLLNSASQVTRKVLREFGLAFGVAYQIYDDCLDVFGDEIEAGKSLGSDLVSLVPSFPIVEFFRRASSEDRIGFLDLWKAQSGKKRDLIDFFCKYDILDFGKARIRQLLDKARCLITENFGAGTALEYFLDYVAEKAIRLDCKRKVEGQGY